MHFSYCLKKLDQRVQVSVFFYNSADYVRTGDAADAFAGNGPIFVGRDGCVRLLDSSDDWVDQL
jgi:hypothetical protein